MPSCIRSNAWIRISCKRLKRATSQEEAEGVLRAAGEALNKALPETLQDAAVRIADSLDGAFLLRTRWSSANQAKLAESSGDNTTAPAGRSLLMSLGLGHNRGGFTLLVLWHQQLGEPGPHLSASELAVAAGAAGGRSAPFWMPKP